MEINKNVDQLLKEQRYIPLKIKSKILDKQRWECDENDIIIADLRNLGHTLDDENFSYWF